MREVWVRKVSFWTAAVERSGFPAGRTVPGEPAEGISQLLCARLSGDASPDTTSLSHVAFGNGLFVAASSSEVFVYSDRWQQVPWPSSIRGLGFGHDTFVVTGPGAVFTSTNGIAWNRRDVGTSAELDDAAFGKETFVVVGSNGTILQSANVLNPAAWF